MSYRRIKFEPEHAIEFSIQDGQASERTYFADWTIEEWRTVAAGGPAWTALDGDVMLCIGGVIPAWHGRATTWTLLSCQVNRRNFLPLHRDILSILDTLQIDSRFRRLETTVLAGWPPAKRWIESLGFLMEGILRSYCPQGRRHLLYARIRP